MLLNIIKYVILPLVTFINIPFLDSLKTRFIIHSRNLKNIYLLMNMIGGSNFKFTSGEYIFKNQWYSFINTYVFPHSHFLFTQKLIHITLFLHGLSTTNLISTKFSIFICQYFFGYNRHLSWFSLLLITYNSILYAKISSTLASVLFHLIPFTI